MPHYVMPKCVVTGSPSPYKGQEDTGAKVIEATEFKFPVRSDLGFKKPDSDFKYIRPNFLSEIIT